ncbi:uncharacterized protein MONBRDRAFT_5067 [Monosiga brevicollis MX1]|uniref:Tetratricopeptide repeat protein 29 n=1 Tax=Monosiga brevicollis TaxID=81824 RepID=A9UPT5_MONBE|nr:uncharacterized protein MONBRDRAFT_5067 [Monosiga brevicollis MX1]EDQ92477.1 predicted protein [Monosiga brevicollis MX1]|eukprot:XP_001742239.1 hypothetical protein [Monosiga brevicollis MX1]
MSQPLEANVFAADIGCQTTAQGNWREAVQLLEQAAEAASEHGNTEAEFKACQAIANFLKKQGRLHQVLTVAQRQLELAEQSKQPTLIARLHNTIGGIYYDLATGRDRSESPILQSAKLHDSTSDPPATTTTPTPTPEESASAVVRHLGSAVEHFEHALALGRALHDRSINLKAYRGLGHVCLVRDQRDAAMEYLELYRKTAKGIGQPKEQARACGIMADQLALWHAEGYSAYLGGDKDVFNQQIRLREEQAACALDAKQPVWRLTATFALAQLNETSGSYTEYYGERRARELYADCLKQGREIPLSELGEEGAAIMKEAAAKLEYLNSSSCTLQ